LFFQHINICGTVVTNNNLVTITNEGVWDTHSVNCCVSISAKKKEKL
jgi:hypothetical protein